MKLTPDSGVSRQLVLLAPPGADTSGFTEVDVNRVAHTRLIEALQRFRGEVYGELGAVSDSHLVNGRHIQEADDRAWHIISLGQDNDEVFACARYFIHDNSVDYSELAISHSALAASERWGRKLRAAVESELSIARDRGIPYVELGGWAIAAALRCTTEAVRMLCASYALFSCLGGALGISTARRVCSAPVLRRIGGRTLSLNGMDMPPYFEPEFNCEVEALRFDSSRPNSKYLSWISAARESLMSLPVIAAAPSQPSSDALVIGASQALCAAAGA